VGEKGTLIHCWWECKLVQPLWKTVCRLLKKLNIDLPCDTVIQLLGIYLKECDSGVGCGLGLGFGGEEVIQIMYTHVSKCRNGKIKLELK
jgi:hypothetical protein